MLRVSPRYDAQTCAWLGRRLSPEAFTVDLRLLRRLFGSIIVGENCVAENPAEGLRITFAEPKECSIIMYHGEIAG